MSKMKLLIQCGKCAEWDEIGFNYCDKSMSIEGYIRRDYEEIHGNLICCDCCIKFNNMVRDFFKK